MKKKRTIWHRILPQMKYTSLTCPMLSRIVNLTWKKIVWQTNYSQYRSSKLVQAILPHPWYYSMLHALVHFEIWRWKCLRTQLFRMKEYIWLVNKRAQNVFHFWSSHDLFQQKPLQRVLALCENAKFIVWHRCFTVRSSICELGLAGNDLITDRRLICIIFPKYDSM